MLACHGCIASHGLSRSPSLRPAGYLEIVQSQLGRDAGGALGVPEADGGDVIGTSEVAPVRAPTKVLDGHPQLALETERVWARYKPSGFISWCRPRKLDMYVEYPCPGTSKSQAPPK